MKSEDAGTPRSSSFGLTALVSHPEKPLVLPGVANALTARIAEDVGFEAVYISGAGIANTYLGAPDVGLLTLSELIAQVSAVRSAVDIPIVVDADTGFGNALNVRRSITELARAGANAVQLEDQVTPKRCGHFADKRVIPREEMVGKIRAALDARPSEDFLVIARTDARAVHSLTDALDRAARYQEVGADILFVEAPEGDDEMRLIGKSLDAPLVANMVEGGRTPLKSSDELTELGFTIQLYANAAMRAGILATQHMLQHLRASGDTRDVLDQMVSWDERQRLVGKPEYDALSERYGAG